MSECEQEAILRMSAAFSWARISIELTLLSEWAFLIFESIWGKFDELEIFYSILGDPSRRYFVSR